MHRVALAAFVAFALAPAWAQDADPNAALAQLAQNFESYERAQQRLAGLEAEYARGMNSRDLAGENRARVVAGIAEAKRELAAARAAHPGLFEAARQAGVPWSELDRYEALPAPPAAAGPRIEADPDEITTGSENVDDAGVAEAEDSDALDATAENVDDESTGASEDVDAADGGASEDSDDLRATSRDPD